ncbi:hydroxyacid dehydrogenase [Rhizobium rhizogenes]|uniref:hydroxyacid dehydrogenase n=1 Tax=Rhizobium rhizogenes TaxID=359 RepID=UPI0015732C5A|nr:hydroxyacid dehydrogenase [Rhizobium rhizogenes]NTF96100.1 hydroxyacid dehydrogenase [Rhizobium rhizogenes]
MSLETVAHSIRPDPTPRKLILVAHVLGDAGWSLIRARRDIDAVSFPNLIAPQEFNALLRSGDQVAGAILGPTAFGEPEIMSAPGIKVVSRIGVGFDAIDVPVLSRKGVPLMVTTTANAASVAEHTLFFILSLAKRATQLHALVRAGRWGDRMNALPDDLAGKTVLIVGFGRIGSRVARLCQAFAMRVLVYDPYVRSQASDALNVQHVDALAEAVAISDFVTIHCPKSVETLGLFGHELLAKMKPTACLINTARGGIVDDAALFKRLVSGHIHAAAIDVFDPEPPLRDSPLLSLPNVIVSPHVAGVTKQSVERMAEVAVKNVLSVLDGRPLRENTINPEVFD